MEEATPGMSEYQLAGQRGEAFVQETLFRMGWEVVKFGRHWLEGSRLNQELSKGDSPLRYTPDFVVWRPSHSPRFVDAKSRVRLDGDKLTLAVGALEASRRWEFVAAYFFVWEHHGQAFTQRSSELLAMLSTRAALPSTNGSGPFYLIDPTETQYLGEYF